MTRVFHSALGLFVSILFFGPESRAQDPAPTARFEIIGGSAQPGEPVALPFVVNSSSELQAFSLSVDFDEEVLEATAIEQVFARPDGQDWRFWRAFIDNANETPGNDGVTEGYLAAAAIFDFQATASILPPSGTDNVILAFQFVVRPDAPAGSTQLQFQDGAFPEGAVDGILNNATLQLQAATITTDVSPLTIGGRLEIVAGFDLFLRGDCDGNGGVNVTDAICILNGLFSGAGMPGCVAALNTDGDGEVDIDDAVGLLNFLFAGGPPPVSPYPDCGPVTTAELACETPPGFCS